MFFLIKISLLSCLFNCLVFTAESDALDAHRPIAYKLLCCLCNCFVFNAEPDALDAHEPIARKPDALDAHEPIAHKNVSLAQELIEKHPCLGMRSVECLDGNVSGIISTNDTAILEHALSQVNDSDFVFWDYDDVIRKSRSK